MKNNRLENRKNYSEQALALARRALGRAKEMSMSDVQKRHLLEMIDRAKKLEEAKDMAGALREYNLVSKFVGGFKAEEERKNMEEELQEKAMDYIEEFVTLKAPIQNFSELLAGIDLDRAWKIRKDWQKKHNEAQVLYSLAGLDTPQAWKIRNEIFNDDRDVVSFSSYLALSLTGLDSDRAWKMRTDLINKNFDKNFVLRSTAGLDSDRAWQLRDECFNENGSKEELATSITGLDSERAWQLREKLLTAEYSDIKVKEYVAKNLIYGLAGIDTPQAREYRSMLATTWAKPSDEAMSLAYIDSVKAWDRRESLSPFQEMIGPVAWGLAGIDTEQAWEMRKLLRQRGVGKINIASGIYGGWRMVAVRKAMADRRIMQSLEN